MIRGILEFFALLRPARRLLGGHWEQWAWVEGTRRGPPVLVTNWVQVPTCALRGGSPGRAGQVLLHCEHWGGDAAGAAPHGVEA